MSQKIIGIEIVDGLVRFHGCQGDVLSDVDQDEHKSFASITEVIDAWRGHYAEERACWSNVCGVLRCDFPAHPTAPFTDLGGES